MSPLVEVAGLRVTFPGGVEALRGVSFALERGDSLAVVGETGSGKSTLAMCLAGLLQPPEASGSVKLEGRELLGASGDTLSEIRWAKVALSLQGAPFNPVVQVGAQIAEPLVERGFGKAEARRHAERVADEVLLDPVLLRVYPHELSGGERRRAALAMALILRPDLLVLDEPTGGVDPGTKKELLDRLLTLKGERGFTLIVVSHDLPDASSLADRTMVLYAGQVMEIGSSDAIMADPAHPYTWALVNAYPSMTTTKDLRPIRGSSPDPRAVPAGCPFHPRCTQAESVCREEHPGLVLSRERLVSCHFGGLKTLLAAEGLRKTYRSKHRRVTALKDVSIFLREGESLGVVGPSGSGKSTLAQILSGHLAADAGTIFLEDEALDGGWRKDARDKRRRVQLVMQDPWDALSPRMNVAELVAEPLELNGAGDADRRAAVAAALKSVGLPDSGAFLLAHSHELSGGQLQRIALARALIAQPKVLVADEPTAMLDASEQARMLVVLRERQIEMGLGLIVISHDISVVRKVTDRIVVLADGLVVEEGPSHLVSTHPQSETTRLLIEAAPRYQILREPVR